MILGCICDDFTGASDIAATLATAGARTVLYSGAPDAAPAADVQAGVIALKSRTIPSAEAVSLSLGALEWLRAQGCRQIVFKYCSTFDSTDDGNIGPVAEALLDALGADRAVVCPAFPAAGRTIYQGHLFVHDRLLSESGMERHPLTPMTDPDVRRVLRRQSRGEVGHVAHRAVSYGAQAIREAVDAEAAAGRRLIVVDATSDADLEAIGAAVASHALVTGGSGVARGLPANFRAANLMTAQPLRWSPIEGPSAALAGSTSVATRAQILSHREAGAPCRAIDVGAVIAGEINADILAAWALEQASDIPPLLYSSDTPEAVAAAQAQYGKDRAAHAIETLFAATAQKLVEGGVRRLISAGGETSGAIVEALALDGLEIGPEIDPGVPAMRAGELGVALKSGNFGGADFFMKAARVLASASEAEGR